MEITEDLPPNGVIDRWLGEPVRCLILPTSLFLTNKKGFPCLAKKHQELVIKFFRVKNKNSFFPSHNLFFQVSSPISH